MSHVLAATSPLLHVCTGIYLYVNQLNRSFGLTHWKGDYLVVALELSPLLVHVSIKH